MSEEDAWPQISETEKRRYRLIEAAIFCQMNRTLMQQGNTPLYLILFRCNYVSGLLGDVYKDCSDLCRLASCAEKPSQFTEACDLSVKRWNEIIDEETRKRNQSVGVV